MTLMQRLRLWWKGSQRRRDEFGKTAQWGTAPVVSETGQARAPVVHAIDRDGVLSAYLDQSERTNYFLDLASGDVIEAASSNFPRIPTMNEEEDRAAFIAANGLSASAPFRETIAKDRTLERAWYNFKTKRANDAIDAWLKSIGRG